jgi:uncharacterized protein YbjT (DUF2867 family)
VSADYLEATTVVCIAARAAGSVEVFVNMSEMTVSQMSATNTGESRQQRLHWMSEHVVSWSGLPTVQIRPTVFLDTPIFTSLAAPSIRDRGVLALLFGTGRTSPIAAHDVARVISAVLRNPGAEVGKVLELMGPESLDVDGLAEQYGQGLGQSIIGVRQQW